MFTTEDIKKRLWDGANELRGSMDASRYKDYMLGLMFYKFLSDKTLQQFKVINGNQQKPTNEIFQDYKQAKEKMGSKVEKMIQDVLGYFVSPEHLYHAWLADINEGTFQLQNVTDSFSAFERSIAITPDSDDFTGLFASSTLDLENTALGSGLPERSKNIKKLILLFADLDMVALQDSDVLGDAYEYLIGQFAMESGKKAGEFYTPRQVSEVMAQVVVKTTSNVKAVYDATVGSASLLLTVSKHLSKDAQKELQYFGQESNTSTYNLTRMNLLLHGVKPNKMTIRNADTLGHDWPEDNGQEILFDAVVMNPPYSLSKWNNSKLTVSDPRFSVAGIMPPDAKGDYAFLLHGLYHLKTGGTMAIVLPHGVLFRGGAEGEIRKKLIDKNYIDAIIGLPSSMFTNTSIPVAVMILKKGRNLNDRIMIIDASNEYTKVGKQNVLQEGNIEKIVDTCVTRKEIKGYSHLATKDEIVKNDYNLNIPRFVEAISEEIPHDVEGHLKGGIPLRDIESLTFLNSHLSDILQCSIKEIRPKYYQLTKSIKDIKDEINQHDYVVKSVVGISESVNDYIQKWWNKLKDIKTEEIYSFRESMLLEIKELLSSYDDIDLYNGYQVIASIWKDSLNRDFELIKSYGFYEASRTKIPNMVTKGKDEKKQEVQDGWLGMIIPLELIKTQLFQDRLALIQDKNNELNSINEEVNEILETAKVEDSLEANVLGECIKDKGDAFDKKEIKQALKQAKKGQEDYLLLKKVDDLLTKSSSLNSETKANEKELELSIQNRIEQLTNEKIDQLVYIKWFGNIIEKMKSLITSQINQEVNTLGMLSKRYETTIEELDVELEQLENQLNQFLSELEVVKNEQC